MTLLFRIQIRKKKTMEISNLELPFDGIPNWNGDVFIGEPPFRVTHDLPKSVTTRRSPLSAEVPDQSHEYSLLFPVQSGNRRRPYKVDPLVRRIRDCIPACTFSCLERHSRLLESALKGGSKFCMGFFIWNWLYRVILYQTIRDISSYHGNYDLNANRWGTTLLGHADRVMQFLDVLEAPKNIGVSSDLQGYAMGQLDDALTSLLLLSDEERGYFAFSPSDAVLRPRPMPVPEKTLYSPFTLTYTAKRTLWDTLPKDKFTGLPVVTSKKDSEVFFTSDNLLRSCTRDVTWVGRAIRLDVCGKRSINQLVASKPSDASILGVEEDVDFYSDSDASLFPIHYGDSVFSEREEMERCIQLRQMALYFIRDVFFQHQEELPLAHFCGTHTTRNAVEVYCWMRDPDMVSVDSGSAFILCRRVARVFRQHNLKCRIYRFRERLRSIKDGHLEQLMNPSIPWAVPGTFLVKLEIAVARKEAIDRLDISNRITISHHRANHEEKEETQEL